jgi:hypothetical protein
LPVTRRMFVSLVAVQPEQEALVVLLPLVLVQEVLVPLVPVLEALVQRKPEVLAELEVPVALVWPEVQEL